MESGLSVSEPSPLLRLVEAAEYLTISPATFYSSSWRRRYGMPAPIRVGGRPRWRREDLDRYIREREQDPA